VVEYDVLLEPERQPPAPLNTHYVLPSHDFRNLFIDLVWGVNVSVYKKTWASTE
jgi:hypothetical protein